MVYLPPPLWTRGRRLALFGCSGLVLVLAALFQWHRQDPQPASSGWDEARLARELEALGYHVHLEARDREGALLPTGHPRIVMAGVYACRDEPADWDEVASRLRGSPDDWPRCVVAWRGSIREPPGDYLVVGPLVLFGDPAELGRVSRRLGLSR